MIKCPKCGFEQPEDQYCASCGVNMSMFIPPTTPLFNRIKRSIVFQSLIIIIAVTSVTFWYNEHRKIVQQEEIKRRVEFLKKGAQQHTQEEIEELEYLEAKLAASKKSEVFVAPPSPTPAAPTALDTSVNTASLSTPKNDSETPATEDKKNLVDEKSGGLEVQVYYTETNTTFVQSFLDDAQSAGNVTNFGEYTAGPLPNIKKIIAQGRTNSQIRILHTVRKDIERPQTPVQWFTGVKEPNTNYELGLTTLISLNTFSYPIKGEIEVLRALHEGKDPSAPPLKQSMAEQLDLGKDMGFFMVGTLPHLDLTEKEMDLFQNSILKVFLSPSFQSKETEFVIFVEFPQSGNKSP